MRQNVPIRITSGSTPTQMGYDMHPRGHRRRTLLVLLATAVLLPMAALTTSGSSAAASNPSHQTEAVAAQHVDWVYGWERTPGDAPFSFHDCLSRFYSSANDLALYDDFDPQHRVATSAAEYGSFWEPVFTTLRSAEHGIAVPPDVVVSGNIAASKLIFVARLQARDGTVTGIRTTSSLVFQRERGQWKIIREHNSSVVLPADQFDAAWQSADRR